MSLTPARRPAIVGGMQDVLDRLVEDLELSVRSANALMAAGIVYVGELVQLRDEDLAALEHANRKTTKELREVVETLGFSPGAALPDWSRPDGQPTRRGGA